MRNALAAMTRRPFTTMVAGRRQCTESDTRERTDFGIMTQADHRKTREPWWREPLVHFLALGALLFLLFNWRGNPASDRIVITPGRIEAIVATFARTWQRPPSEQELKGLLDDYVREEMATREAVALGLDRDDTIIRRRLRQKLEFMAADTVDATPPTDAELQAWLMNHPDDFRTEPEVAFRQVYLNPERRVASLEADARQLLARLSAAGSEADVTTLGDSLMLPNEVARTPRSDVVRQFGDEFADAILKVAPGRWEGPLTSGYGRHLVLVRERSEAHLPTLAEARPLVERELLNARRTRALAAMYERMLERYRVTLEKRRMEPQTTEALPEPGRGGSR